MRKILRDVMCLLPLLAVCPVTGCGSGSIAGVEKQYRQMGLAEVTGTVTLDGQPLANAQIQFSANKMPDSSFAYGVTDSSGQYRMRLDTYHTGVLPGYKVVRIWTTLRGPGINELLKQTGGLTPAGKEIVPTRYNQQSELSVTVEQNGRHTFDFDLQSGGATVAAPQSGEEEMPAETEN